jgi:hypothetical protein
MKKQTEDTDDTDVYLAGLRAQGFEPCAEVHGHLNSAGRPDIHSPVGVAPHPDVAKSIAYVIIERWSDACLGFDGNTKTPGPTLGGKQVARDLAHHPSNQEGRTVRVGRDGHTSSRRYLAHPVAAYGASLYSGLDRKTCRTLIGGATSVCDSCADSTPAR